MMPYIRKFPCINDILFIRWYSNWYSMILILFDLSMSIRINIVWYLAEILHWYLHNYHYLIYLFFNV